MLGGIKKLAAYARLIAQRRAINDGRSFNAGGFKRWRVGAARITKVVELEGEGFGEFLLPDVTADALKKADLEPGHIGEKGGLKLSVHSFVVEIAGKIILVDTNVGNGKRRKVPIWNRLSTPWLKDLHRAGFAPDAIDLVVLTHLHIDHVGWNTRWVDGQWTPTFPNARYVAVDEEFAFWAARLDDRARAELFRDSITPIRTAGLMDLVPMEAEIAPGVRLVATPGHTDHHAAVEIHSEGERALITGDFIHHPIQIAHPEWSSAFDTKPATSVATRQAWLSRLADDGTLVLGTAFPDPSAGRIVRTASGYRFRPIAPAFG